MSDKIVAWAAIMPTNDILIYSDESDARETAEGYGDHVVKLVEDDGMRDYILDKRRCGEFCRSHVRFCHDCFPDGKFFRPVWDSSTDISISEESHERRNSQA